MKERIHLKKMGSFFCKKIAPTVLVTVGAVGIIYSVIPEVNVLVRRYGLEAAYFQLQISKEKMFKNLFFGLQFLIFSLHPLYLIFKGPLIPSAIKLLTTYRTPPRVCGAVRQFPEIWGTSKGNPGSDALHLPTFQWREAATMLTASIS